MWDRREMQGPLLEVYFPLEGRSGGDAATIKRQGIVRK